MEYKVFLYWSRNEKPEVRRFTIDLESSSTIYKLHEKVLSVCPRLQGKVYSLMWKDEEGDDIIITTDEELCTAQGHMGIGVKKVYIYIKDDQFDDDENKDANGGEAGNEMQHDFTEDKVQHNGVVCDSCNGPVVGFRYKCAVCLDYDLCTACESAGSHPEHCMVRVPLPTLPRDVVRAALKRSRYFLKTVVGDKRCEDFDACAFKSRRERSSAGPSGERKQRGHRHEERHRRPRASWLDTFTTYMNEFANLAGDPESNATNIANQPTNGASNAPTAPSAPTEEQKKASEENAPPNTPKEPATPSTSCPFSGGEILIDDIQKMLQLYLSGGLNAFIPKQTADQATMSSEKASTPTEQATASAEQGSTSAEQAPSTGSLNDDDVEMNQAERAPLPTQSDNSSGGSDGKADSSPDRADGWTVINKEKDLMDSYVKSDGNPTLAPQIGFNLPQQFQEQVTISQAQSLYPPLNAATAVLNPKVPETIPPAAREQAAAASAPQAQPTAPQAQPTAQQTPKRQIMKPHIAAALQQMLAMGFTNDGGWLTQLLENKDGNIASVLDLLTPVTPKK